MPVGGKRMVRIERNWHKGWVNENMLWCGHAQRTKRKWQDSLTHALVALWVQPTLDCVQFLQSPLYPSTLRFRTPNPSSIWVSLTNFIVVPGKVQLTKFCGYIPIKKSLIMVFVLSDFIEKPYPESTLCQFFPNFLDTFCLPPFVRNALRRP